ncbi:hypothetical protein NADFUDRAFT_52039 [Nadsonia fulvescens var. elongata DSM 6958]|uniref:Ribosomal RNA-processing protein 17 n=1 Tax=Nadsonia fulvescens var. elongata DSM 6958 TaxID=857566 RepID=A0A1E3PKT2_9ASCO|nr:hypothetical protein NADFUDRAFT_52039 [Nadsonia fulvescens var. elongata DSM 6958]
MAAKKTNREILTSGDKNYARKKIKKHGVEEVTFDRSKRTEYLTGFHKRKMERKEVAVAKAKEMANTIRLQERKKLREDRKKDQDKEKKRFEDAMKDIAKARNGEFDSDSEMDKDSHSESEEEVTEGEESEKSSTINHVAEKVFENDDEDAEGVTTVTIESINLEEDSDAEEKAAKIEEYKKQAAKDKIVALNRAKQLAKNAKNSEKKVKVKKFRYLTKQERQSARNKDRLMKKEKKEKRKGE